MSDVCRRVFEDSLSAKQRFAAVGLPQVERAAGLVIEVLRAGGKLLAFGNGGSAADAQHLACELVNRFLCERPALPAIALTTDSSVLTSIANDSAFEEVFVRQVEALGRPGDLALAISTSGRSPSVVRALARARELGLRTLALAGRPGSPLAAAAELAIEVEPDSTPRIQEIHVTVIHALCAAVDEAFGPAPTPEPAP